jgi:pyridoxamine 5'-phosphate oxidase
MMNILPENKELSEKSTYADPFYQFNLWYSGRLKHNTAIPDAVNLGTASSSGRVSVRTVLLKGYDSRGFVFFTNYNSEKGRQLLQNPFATLHFHWPESGQQIRIEGLVEKTDESESENYFRTRPRESQLAAWASDQSSIIPNRLHLESRFDHFSKKFADKPIDKPPHWGGFRLIPDMFEFWRDRNFRLHDRIQYKYSDGIWTINRLAP